MANERPTWGSKIGFILAVSGSAIGLANIWRFPYLLGNYGGAAFFFIYLLFLFLLSFPILLTEIIIGKKTRANPSLAFKQLGGGVFWPTMGKISVLTGFIISSFYSVVAAWIVGYVVEALKMGITSFQHSQEAANHFSQLIQNPYWTVGYHFVFLVLCRLILLLGVRKGIEKWNEILIPLLFIILVAIVAKALTLEDAGTGLRFLLSPDWSVLTPVAFMTALGQAFFTLSLGQGTMVTYGSYLDEKASFIKSCGLVILMDTMVSFLMACAVFMIVFSEDVTTISSGPGLIFNTLPWIFSQIPGGSIVAILFFVLVLLAAITSQISAMEPPIAYLIDEKGFSRRWATFTVTFGAFALGIPSALSLNLLAGHTIYGANFLDCISFLGTNILIPLGGLGAVILVAWKVEFHKMMDCFSEEDKQIYLRYPKLTSIFLFCLKYVIPILIVLIFLNVLGVFKLLF